MDNSAYDFFLWTLSAVSVLALCTAAVSVVLHAKSGSARQLVSRVRQLEIDFEELFNAVSKWTNRARVADARAKIGQAQAAPALPERGTPEYKKLLRARAANGAI